MRLNIVIILLILTAPVFAGESCASSDEVQQLRGVIDLVARQTLFLSETEYLTASVLNNKTQALEIRIDNRMNNLTTSVNGYQISTNAKIQSIKYELYALAMLAVLLGVVINQMLVAGAYRHAAKVEKDRIIAMRDAGKSMQTARERMQELEELDKLKEGTE